MTVSDGNRQNGKTAEALLPGFDFVEVDAVEDDVMERPTIGWRAGHKHLIQCSSKPSM